MFTGFNLGEGGDNESKTMISIYIYIYIDVVKRMRKKKVGNLAVFWSELKNRDG